MQIQIFYSHCHRQFSIEGNPSVKYVTIVTKYLFYLTFFFRTNKKSRIFKEELESYFNQVGNKCRSLVQFPSYQVLQIKYSIIPSPMQSYPHWLIYNYWNLDNQIKKLFYFLNFKFAFKFKSTFCKTPCIWKRWIIKKN